RGESNDVLPLADNFIEMIEKSIERCIESNQSIELLQASRPELVADVVGRVDINREVVERAALPKFLGIDRFRCQRKQGLVLYWSCAETLRIRDRFALRRMRFVFEVVRERASGNAIQIDVLCVGQSDELCWDS